MSRKTSDLEKIGVIHAAVINLKKKDIGKKQCLKLEGMKDIGEAYKYALSCGRNFIHFRDETKRDIFLKEAEMWSHKWVNNGNKWVDDDFVVEKEIVTDEDVKEACKLPAEITTDYESREKFREEIELTDKKVENRISNSNIALVIINSAIERGAKQFSKKFLDRLGIETELAATCDTFNLYSCEGVNGVFEII